MTLDPDFLYPISDDGPIVWYSMKTLQIVKKYQTKWFKWYNQKWSSRLNCTLEVLRAEQFAEGFPATANIRTLYCFGTGIQKAPDSYEEQAISLGLAYSTGKADLDGDDANLYGDFRESSFYLQALSQLFYRLTDQSLTTAEYTQGWPTDNPFFNTFGDVETTTKTDPPNVVIQPTQFNPDSRISERLNKVGLQLYLQLELLINPYPIQKPR